MNETDASFDRRMLETLICPRTQTTLEYDADRQDLIRTQLRRIADTAGLSRDATEMVSRILGA